MQLFSYTVIQGIPVCLCRPL